MPDVTCLIVRSFVRVLIYFIRNLSNYLVTVKEKEDDGNVRNRTKIHQGKKKKADFVRTQSSERPAKSRKGEDLSA